LERWSDGSRPATLHNSVTPLSQCPMKIGVVGCGALGSYYGAKLCRDGQETHWLLRSDYECVRAKGVRVRSVTRMSPPVSPASTPCSAGAGRSMASSNVWSLVQ